MTSISAPKADASTMCVTGSTAITELFSLSMVCCMADSYMLAVSPCHSIDTRVLACSASLMSSSPSTRLST